MSRGKNMNKMIKKKFNWDDIDLTPLKGDPKSWHYGIKTRKILIQNTERYIAWVMDVLRKVYKKKLKDDEQFSSCAIYMNKKNNDFLQRCLAPMNWLFYSPVTRDSLKDDEYEINESRIIEEY